MDALSPNTALILIDVQKGFDDPRWGVRNNPHAEINIGLLLSRWRRLKQPIVHVKHMSNEADSPLRPGQEGNDFKNSVVPVAGEHVEQKTVNSAFIGTGLEQYLRERKIEALIIVGISTDHCVSTTTRMAGNLGFKTFVVADATHTFNRTGYDGTKFSAEHVHAGALASLHNEFATVVETAEIISAPTLI